MKKIKIGILVFMIFSLTACGNSNYITDDGTPVEFEKTGQILQKDIDIINKNVYNIIVARERATAERSGCK